MFSTKAAPSATFLSAALFMSSVYWIGSWAAAPPLTLDQAILFRPFGDSDYLPQVSALAHLEFGETSVREMVGQGVRSFPFAAILFHAALVRLLGDPGFVVADILAYFLYGSILTCFLRTAGITRGIAEIITLVVLTERLNLAVSPAVFWYSRFPRPLITEIAVVAFMMVACRIVSSRATTSNIGPWVLIGALGAFLLQSDIYWATTLALVAFFICICLIRDFAAVLRGVAISGATAAIGSVPFIYQRFHESPDVLRRLGVLSVGHSVILIGSRRLVAIGLVSVFVGTALYYSFRRTDGRARAAWLIITATTVASLLNGPLTLSLLGKGIQLYHYIDRARRAIGYGTLLSAGWALQEIVRWFYRKIGTHEGLGLRVRRAALAIFALACCVMTARSAHLLIIYPNTPWLKVQGHPSNRYKEAFAELHSEILGSSLYRNAQVLGTFDTVLANWWEYRNRYLYVPDFFNSTLSDSEIETRLYSFLVSLKVSRDEFNRLLDDEFLIMRLTGEKYQVSRRSTGWPITDYSLDARRRIAWMPIDFGSWALELPISERARLIDKYARFNQAVEPYRQLDVIVLDKNAERQLLHPEVNARLAWANEVFEIWLPRR
jgi:hypothetical protein